MHQFKGTALRAGSSSLVTKCVCPRCKFVHFRECSQLPWLSGSRGRMLPFPLLPGVTSAVPGCWAGGAEPSGLLQTLKSKALASQPTGAGSSPSSRTAPGHSPGGPEKEEKPHSHSASLLLPPVILTRASAESKFTPVHAWRLLPITHSLAFHFKITARFSPRFVLVQRLPQGSSYSN